jgi:hypothetical protein
MYIHIYTYMCIPVRGITIDGSDFALTDIRTILSVPSVLNSIFLFNIILGIRIILSVSSVLNSIVLFNSLLGKGAIIGV